MNYIKKESKNLIMIVLSAFLSAFAVKGFVEVAHLYPAGFLGVSVFIANMLDKYLNITLYYNLIYLILNILSTFLVLKVAGKKLIVYSVLQYLLVSFFISLMPPFILVNDLMLLAIFGGVIAGISCWLALEANASSGGTDFIAIYFSHYFHRSCWNEVMLFNIAVLVIAGFSFGFADSFYSIIYQFIVTAIIDHLHTRYQLNTLHIITDKKEEIAQTIFQILHHGLTEIPVKGVYSGKDKAILYLVCNEFEIEKVIKQIKKVDPNAFVLQSKTKLLLGQYIQEKLE